MVEKLPEIPIEDLFTEIPISEVPLRWLSVKTVTDILDVTERTVRNYIREGKVDCIRKTVSGRKRVFISNRSVYDILDKRVVVNIDEDPEEQEEDNPLLDAFLDMGNVISKL